MGNSMQGQKCDKSAAWGPSRRAWPRISRATITFPLLAFLDAFSTSFALQAGTSLHTAPWVPPRPLPWLLLLAGPCLGALSSPCMGWAADAHGRRLLLMVTLMGTAMGHALLAAAMLQEAPRLLALSQLLTSLLHHSPAVHKALAVELCPPGRSRTVALARVTAIMQAGALAGRHAGELAAGWGVQETPALAGGLVKVALVLVVMTVPGSKGLAGEVAGGAGGLAGNAATSGQAQHSPIGNFLASAVLWAAVSATTSVHLGAATTTTTTATATASVAAAALPAPALSAVAVAVGTPVWGPPSVMQEVLALGAGMVGVRPLQQLLEATGQGGLAVSCLVTLALLSAGGAALPGPRSSGGLVAVGARALWLALTPVASAAALALLTRAGPAGELGHRVGLHESALMLCAALATPGRVALSLCLGRRQVAVLASTLTLTAAAASSRARRQLPPRPPRRLQLLPLRRSPWGPPVPASGSPPLPPLSPPLSATPLSAPPSHACESTPVPTAETWSSGGRQRGSRRRMGRHGFRVLSRITSDLDFSVRKSLVGVFSSVQQAA